MPAQGIIVYGRDGYEDGGEFVEQVNALVASRPDVAFSIADELSIGIEKDKVFVALPDGEVISELNGNLPKWAMMRTSDWTVALAFEQMGVKTFPDSDYIRTASDKVLSHLVMSKELYSLDTLCRKGELDVSEFPPPYIVKSATGFGGYDVAKISSVEEGISASRKIEESGNVPVFQKLASSPDDLRVYIMGGEIMFAILRHAQAGADKANFCQGAQGTVYELTEGQKEQIARAIALFPENLGFISIDFLIDVSGRLVFNEMNCFPGLLGLVQMGWQEGFVEEYVSYIENTVKQLRRPTF